MITTYLRNERDWNQPHTEVAVVADVPDTDDATPVAVSDTVSPKDAMDEATDEVMDATDGATDVDGAANELLASRGSNNIVVRLGDIINYNTRRISVFIFYFFHIIRG